MTKNFTPQAFTKEDFDELFRYKRTGNREDYYQKLSDMGYAYGELALGVVRDDTLSGRTAINNMYNRAEQLGVEFGKEEELKVGKELMERDFAAREDLFKNEENQGNLTLSHGVIEEYHTATFKVNKLDEKAWTAYAPLKAMDSEAEEQEMWDLMLSGATDVSVNFKVIGKMLKEVWKGDDLAKEWLKDPAAQQGTKAFLEEAIDNGSNLSGGAFEYLKELTELSGEEFLKAVKNLPGELLDVLIPPAYGIYNNPENNEAFINSGYLPEIASTGDIYEQLGMTQEEYAAYYEARYQEFIEKEIMPYDSDGDGVLNEEEKAFRDDFLATVENNEENAGSQADADALTNHEDYNPAYDQNGDGVLDEEFEDRDKDGNGYISEEEAALSQQELDNVAQVPPVWGIDQTMALIAAVGSLDAFIDALENGDELAAIAYILDTISSLDDASKGLINGGILQSEQISNWIDNTGEAFLSAYHLYEAISNGESVDAIVAGIDFVDDIYDGITDVIAGENTQGITINGVDIGGYLSVFATVNALSDGNIGGAISQGYSAYTQLSGIEGSGNIAGAIAVATSVMNGDEFGAALAMTNFIPGYGPVIYAGLSVLRATGVLQPVEDLYGDYSEFLNDNDWAALVLPGGQAIYAISKLSKMFADDPPDPEAQMEFIRDTNGNISFSTSSNVTGAGLEKVLQEQGSAWSEYMQSLDEAYSPYLPDGQINVDNLPQLGIMQDYQNPDVGLEWSLQGGNNLGNAKQILGVGDEVTGEDIARGLRDTMLITHLNDSWVVGESTYVDPVTGKEIKQTHYSPLGYVSIGSPNVVNVVGTGIFVGGGNVEARQETQYAKYDEIKALTNKKTPTPVKELSNVTNTHLIPKDLFHGENGKLLAVALGAGAVSLSDYAASQDYLDYFTPDEVSVFDDAIYGALLEESSNIIIGGVSYNAAGKYAKEEIAPSGDYSIDYSDSLFERHDVYRDVIQEAVEESSPVVHSRPATGFENLSFKPFIPVNNPTLFKDLFDKEIGQYVKQVEQSLPEDLIEGLPDKPVKPVDPDKPRKLGLEGGRDQFSMLEDRAIYLSVEDLLANDGSTGSPQVASTGSPQVASASSAQVGSTGSAQVASTGSAQVASTGSAQAGSSIEFLRLGRAEFGTVRMDEDGRIEFIPEKDYNDSLGIGEAGFSYWIKNSKGVEEEVWVDIDVAGVHDNPDAEDDALMMAEDTVLNLTQLLANDNSVDRDDLRLANVSASVGEVYEEEGQWYFKPPVNYSGHAQLVYTLKDDDGYEAVARADITITDDGVDAPILNEDDLSKIIGLGQEESEYRFNAKDLLANDASTGSAQVASTGSAQVASTGSAQVASTGSAQVASTGSAQVASTGSAQVASTGSAQVASTGSAQVASASSAQVASASSAQVASASSAQGVLILEGIRLKDESQGSISYDKASGEIVFTPAENVKGRVEFIYRAGYVEGGVTEYSDGYASVDLINTVDEFKAEGINGIEVLEDSVSFFRIDDLVKNIVSVDGDASMVAVRMVDGADYGRVDRMDDGTIRFIPDPDYSGPVSFEVRLHNGYERIALPISLNVMAVNDAPAYDEAELITEFSGVEEQVVEIKVEDLLAGSSDIEGDSFSIGNVRLSDSGLGQISYDAEKGVISFTPSENVHGLVDFEFDLTDVNGGVSSFSREINLSNVNDTVLIGDGDFVASDESQTLTMSKAELLGFNQNDSQGENQTNLVNAQVSQNEAGEYVDIDAEVLNIINPQLVEPDWGSLSVNSEGGLEFVPNNAYFDAQEDQDTPLEISFSYQIDDGISPSEVIKGSFQVSTINDAPEFSEQGDLVEVDATEGDAEISFSTEEMLAGAIDAEGDDFDITEISLSDETQGVIEYDAINKEIIFKPSDENINGKVEFGFTLTDARGAESLHKRSIDIKAVNDTLEITDQDLGMKGEDEIFEISIETLLSGSNYSKDNEGRYVDADGEVLILTDLKLSDVDAGLLEYDAEKQTLRFSANKDYEGHEIDGNQNRIEFSYRVDDGVGLSDEAEAVLKINPENDAPIGLEHVIEGNEGEMTRFNVSDLMQGAKDVEQNAFNVSDVRLKDESQGELVFNKQSGEISFTANENYHGDVEFIYDLQEDSDAGIKSSNEGIIRVANRDEDDFAIVDKTLNLKEGQATVLTGGFLLEEYANGKETGITELDGQLLSISDVAIVDADGEDVSAYVQVSVGEDSQSLVIKTDDAYSGNVVLNYTVTDGVHAHSVSLATSIEAVDDAPISEEIALDSGVEEQEYILSAQTLLVGASDEEGGVVSVSDIRLADNTQGKLDVVRYADGSVAEVKFMPAQDFYGDVQLNYELSDENGNSSTHSTSLAIENVNDTAQITDKGYWDDKAYDDQKFNLFEDEEKVYSREELLDVLVDVDNETLNISHVLMNDAQAGRVEQTEDGGVRFIPAKNYVGDASFSILVDDGSGEAPIEASMSIKIWDRNDGPEINPDGQSLHYDMLEERELRISGGDVLSKFSADAEGEALRIVGVDGASNGVGYYDVNTNEVVYQPQKDYFGDAKIRLVVEDASGAFNTIEVDIDIENTFDPIKAINDELHALEDTSKIFSIDELLGNDLNPDRVKLKIVAISEDSIEHGSIELLSDGRVRYNASEAEYSGIQEFSYTVEDENGQQSTAKARLIVNEVNDAPKVEPMTAQTLEDEAISFNIKDLLANASDVEDDWMQIIGARVDDSYGEIKFDDISGVITYTPTENFNSDLYNSKPNIEYLVKDERGGERWGKIEMNVIAVNDPPVAHDDVLFVWGDGPGNYGNPTNEDLFFLNDEEYDGEHDQLYIDRLTQGENGTVVRKADGTVEYRANEGVKSGEDSFEYRVTDGVTTDNDGNPIDSSDWASVDVKIIENHPPITIAVVSTILNEDVKASFSFQQIFDAVYDQDLGHQELPEKLSIVGLINEKYGDARIENGNIVFESLDHFNSVQFEAPASFDVVVEDIVGNRTVVPVEMVYKQKGDAPVANGEKLGVIKEDSEGLVFSIRDLLKHDEDVDRDLGTRSDDYLFFKNLEVANASGIWKPEGEWQELKENWTDQDYQNYLDNEIRFIPKENFDKTAEIKYTIIDKFGLEASAISTIEVTPVNDRPIAEIAVAKDPGYDNGIKNTISVNQLLSRSYDVDGDRLHIELAGTSGGISARVSGGNIFWTADNPGAGSIKYYVVDEHGARHHDSQPLTLNLSIQHYNEPPTITNITEHKEGVNPGKGGGTAKIIVTGQVLATDDDSEGLRYYIGSPGSSKYQDFEINTTTGEWTFEYKTYVGALGGNDPIPYTISTFVDVNFYVVDKEGEIVQTRMTRRYSHSGTVRDYDPADPIVIDMNGDGLNLMGIEESTASFDWDGDGDRDRTGWVGKGDGLLAYDHDGDGKIAHKSEIAFIDYLQGAKTDLEGLRYFDTDGDGFFTANDDEWDKFGVWQDAANDGVDSGGEFAGLDVLGLTGINLYSDENKESIDGNIVHGQTEVMWSDGSTGIAGDLSFQRDENTNTGTDVENDSDFNKFFIEEPEELKETKKSSIESDKVEEHKETEEDSSATSDKMADDKQKINIIAKEQEKGLSEQENETKVDNTTVSEQGSQKDPFDDISDEELDRQEALARQDSASHEPPEAEEVTVVDANATSEGEENMIEEDESSSGTYG